MRETAFLIDLTARLKSARYRDDREHDDPLTLPSRSDLMKYRNRTIPDSGKALRELGAYVQPDMLTRTRSGSG
jgi:hypothetical protein